MGSSPPSEAYHNEDAKSIITSVELPVCLELARSVLLKLNRVLKILCAPIIAFPALFLFWGTRALENGFQIYL